MLSDIDKNIFRGYDIRGLVGKQLSEEVYYTIGMAFASFLYQRRIRDCVIARDIRDTSEAYSKAFGRALTDSGINVYDIGVSLTQIMYFSQYHFLSKAGAMITASHNSKEYNGLKLSAGFSETLLTDEIKSVREIAERKVFEGYQERGKVWEENTFDAYKKDLFKRAPLKNAGYKVVVDSMNATTGLFLPEILREAGCEVIEQNTSIDPEFPLGTPDPTEEKALERLADRVIREKADIGFAYDSDGDRVGVVDSKGNLVWNDVLVALFAKDILEHMPGSPIVFNTLCSKVVSDVIKDCGGQVIMEKTGHSFIKSTVKRLRAPFGGELSGHFFFMDNFYGHDDGAFATLRLLQFLKRNSVSLSEAIEDLPKYISSPEIKLGLADDIKFQLVRDELAQDIRSLRPNAKFVNIDGCRADTDEEMVIVRASQNGPYITIKFESKSRESYDELKESIYKMLKKYQQINWDEGVNTHVFN